MITGITLNMDYVNARRLLVSNSELMSLVLVGCGGTGSWLAPSVVRVARILKEKFGKNVEVFFVDPDRVEAKNCYRQNFCEAEIGRNKADALAWRYGLAWGIEVKALAAKLIHELANYLDSRMTLFIGCVDNGAARRSIKNAVESGLAWWLDCGNHQASGQVLLGCGKESPKNPFELPGFCTWLPLPSVQHPELLEDMLEDQKAQENLSCAEMAMQDSQGLAINQRIAAEATDYLVRMLLTRDLVKFATYIDLASGTTRSKYINPDIVSVSTEMVEVAP